MKVRKKEDIETDVGTSEQAEKQKVPADTTNSTLHWMDKLMQDNSKKMEVLDRKLDSLKSGVRDIQPPGKVQTKTSSKKGKTEAFKDPLKPLTKILGSLKNISVDDEEAYHYLKDLSYLEFDDNMLENSL